MSNNTKLGVGSLNSNNGSKNTAIGAYASYKNTEGFSNTSLGVNAGFFNETGDYNTSLGSAALCNNLNGSSNTAIGSNALLGTKNLSIGNSNTGVGVQSLEENTGDFNTALGAQSGLDLTGGSYNTYLGAKTNASSQDLNHSTAIGYDAKIDASNQIMMGTANETVQVPGNLNVINGQATFNGPFVGGTTGANGINTNTVIGKLPSTIFDVSANHSNVYIGNNILEKYSGRLQNVAVGNRALQNGGTLVDKTVAIGYEALKNYRADDIDPSNTGTRAPGTSSVAVGAFSGLNCKDCTYCTFLGTDADVDSSANSYNNSTAIGYNAKIDASNQIMLGTYTETVKIPGNLNVNYLDSNAESLHLGAGDTSGHVVIGKGEEDIDQQIIIKNIASIKTAYGPTTQSSLQIQDISSNISNNKLRFIMDARDDGNYNPSIDKNSIAIIAVRDDPSGERIPARLQLATHISGKYNGITIDESYVFIGAGNGNQADTSIKCDGSNVTINGNVEVPGTLSYQTYRQPIIFSCIVGRNTSGYYLYSGHSYGIDSVLNDSTGVLTINFSQELELINNRYKPMLSGGFNDLNDGSSGIIFGQNIDSQSTSSFNFVMLDRDNGLKDLADNDTGSVYVTVYYYP